MPKPVCIRMIAAAVVMGLVLSPIAAAVGLAKGLFAAVAEN